MDAIIARIKEYVLIIKSDLEDNDFLDFMVNDVVDKALVYMNRDQLVEQYKEDLVDYPDSSDDFWSKYEYPIPPRVERTLANVVVGLYKTVEERNTADVGAVSSVNDRGQSVSFKNEMANFLSSSDEAEVFAGSLTLLDRYKLGEVLGDTSYYDDRRKPL